MIPGRARAVGAGKAVQWRSSSVAVVLVSLSSPQNIGFGTRILLLSFRQRNLARAIKAMDYQVVERIRSSSK